MKKVWALLAVGTLATVIVGCMIRASDAEIQQINNLAELLAKSAELSQQFERKEITAEQLKQLTLELEDKYTQLTENDLPPNKEINQLEKNINEKLAGIKQTISTTDLILPGRALALWLSEPVGLTIKKEECKKTTLANEGYDSITLVYEWPYETSAQQAKIIAEKAKIPISKEFAMAQEAMSGLSSEELSAITSGDSLKGVVYSNAGLLATDMEYLTIISVDENGKLTIEAINYAQMKK